MSVNVIRSAFLVTILAVVTIVFACVDVSNYLESGDDPENLCAYPGGASMEMDEGDYELDAEECDALNIDISVENVMASADLRTFQVEGEYNLPGSDEVYYIWHIGRQQSYCFVEIDDALEEKTFSIWSRYVDCPSSVEYNVVLSNEPPADDDDSDDDDDNDGDDDSDDDDTAQTKADDDDDTDEGDDDGEQWEPEVLCSFTIDLLVDCPADDVDDDDEDDDSDDDFS